MTTWRILGVVGWVLVLVLVLVLVPARVVKLSVPAAVIQIVPLEHAKETNVVERKVGPIL